MNEIIKLTDSHEVLKEKRRSRDDLFCLVVHMFANYAITCDGTNQ
jgi:hypothetical protein